MHQNLLPCNPTNHLRPLTPLNRPPPPTHLPTPPQAALLRGRRCGGDAPRVLGQCAPDPARTHPGVAGPGSHGEWGGGAIMGSGGWHHECVLGWAGGWVGACAYNWESSPLAALSGSLCIHPVVWWIDSSVAGAALPPSASSPPLAACLSTQHWPSRIPPSLLPTSSLAAHSGTTPGAPTRLLSHSHPPLPPRHTVVQQPGGRPTRL